MVDFFSGSFEETDEPIKARTYVGILQSSEGAEKEAVRGGIQRGICPCRQTGRLSSSSEVRSLLMLGAGDPFGVSDGFGLILAPRAHRDSSAAQHSSSTSEPSCGGRVGELQSR